MANVKAHRGEENIVAVLLVSRVVLDDARAAQLNVVIAGHVNAAAGISFPPKVAGVAGDGAAVDGIVLPEDSHSPAVAPRSIAGDDALAHRGPALVKRDRAGAAASIVVLDGKALDQALVVAGRRVDVDGAAVRLTMFLAVLGRIARVARDHAGSVGGLEGEEGLVEVDAATAIAGGVAADRGAVLQIDVRAAAGIDAAGVSVAEVAVDVRGVQVELAAVGHVHSGALIGRELAVRGPVVAHRDVGQVGGGAVLHVDAAVAAPGDRDVLKRELGLLLQMDAAAEALARVVDQAGRLDGKAGPVPLLVLYVALVFLGEAAVREVLGRLGRGDLDVGVLVHVDRGVLVVADDLVARHLDGDGLAVGDVEAVRPKVPVGVHVDDVALIAGAHGVGDAAVVVGRAAGVDRVGDIGLGGQSRRRGQQGAGQRNDRRRGGG